MTTYITITPLLHSHTSGVCRLLCRPWTYLSSSNLNVYWVKEGTVACFSVQSYNDVENNTTMQVRTFYTDKDYANNKCQTWDEVYN